MKKRDFLKLSGAVGTAAGKVDDVVRAYYESNGNEPGICIFGQFGVRLEDCLYITDDGPQLFSGLSPSIDDPIG